jgi:hypothetical protein
MIPQPLKPLLYPFLKPLTGPCLTIALCTTAISISAHTSQANPIPNEIAQAWSESVTIKETPPPEGIIGNPEKTNIQIEFTPMPISNATPASVIRSLQIELSRTYRSASSTDKALNKKQHWMEYSLPRHQKYGVLHLIKTKNGILALHLEKKRELEDKAWEEQKTILRKAKLSQNTLTINGAKHPIPTI